MGQEGVHLAGVGSILSYIYESIQWGVTHYMGELTKLDYIGGTLQDVPPTMGNLMCSKFWGAQSLLI